MTGTITVTPPAGYFAAVQIETVDGDVVGAQTCQYPDGSPREQITANVKGSSNRLLLRWVYEDGGQGTIVTEYGETHRKGGGR